MGREEDSRGTTQVSRTRRLRLAGRSVLTIISLPCNAGIAVRTTYYISHERLERELRLVLDECNFNNYFAHLWRLLPAYFPLSMPLFYWVSPVTLYYPRKRNDVKA